jgi:hypothetical protein
MRRGREQLSLAACQLHRLLSAVCLGLRTNHPRVFIQKKSLAAGWGANQGTKDLPLPINRPLPSSLIHSCRYTPYTALLLINITPSVRCAPPFFPSHYLSRRIQWASAGKANTDRQIHPVPLHFRLGACCGNTQPCASSTLNGLSADVSHRLAAWAPWAYQRFNFASGLT